MATRRTCLSGTARGADSMTLGCNFLACLGVCFNKVKLPDEEALQQDHTATSEMRLKLRMAGPASAEKLDASGPKPGEVHQVGTWPRLT